MRVPVALAGFGCVEPGATLRPTMLSGPGTLACEEGQRTRGLESAAREIALLTPDGRGDGGPRGGQGLLATPAIPRALLACTRENSLAPLPAPASTAAEESGGARLPLPVTRQSGTLSARAGTRALSITGQTESEFVLGRRVNWRLIDY